MSTLETNNDLTIVYYTANVLGDRFACNTQAQLLGAIKNRPLISVSHRPMKFGHNIVVDLPRHHLSIYKQALIGAQFARTKYIALCEDDILYSPDHFDYRPTPGRFGYNLGYWGLYTWNPSVFSWKGRRNLSQLICERDLFIAAMEERFMRYQGIIPNLGIWAEPGKYERQLGVTVRETEEFYSNPPNIMFSHQDALAFANLGTRKRLGELRAVELPYWGRSEEVVKLHG